MQDRSVRRRRTAGVSVFGTAAAFVLLAGASPAAWAASAAPGTASGAASTRAATHSRQRCAPGEFCAFTGTGFAGRRHVWELTRLNRHGFDDCVPLPDGFDARSVANRSRHPVTVYQGRHCSTQGEFHTVPGAGDYVPKTSFVVRAFMVRRK